jgi:hypothetical protein
VQLELLSLVVDPLEPDELELDEMLELDELDELLELDDMNPSRSPARRRTLKSRTAHY